jgi:HEAT repeat protein
MTKLLKRLVVSAAALGLAAVSSSASADTEVSTHAGRAKVYEHLHGASLEAVSSPEVIRSLFNSKGKLNYAPTKVWQVLEHGEKVECLSCIPLVAGLLYDQHPKTREIAAWWLRRRIFGVFGTGEVYSQVVQTLGDSAQTETRRARAANALGEFLHLAGSKHLAAAIRNDSSPVVREASVKALERMNTQGPDGELALAMGDSDPAVRLAAVRASTRVNVFTDTDALVKRIVDESPGVRQASAAALGTMRVRDSVDMLAFLASPENESEADVRKAAVWSLGQIRDSAAVEAIEAAKNDPNPFVRDAARTAGMRLGR